MKAVFLLKAEMDAGEHLSRAEKATKAVEEDAPCRRLPVRLTPTLMHQTSPRFSGKSRMREGTAKEYRRSFELHLSSWAEVVIDKLPTRNINQHLNTVQKKHLHAAYRAHAVIGATLRHACKVHAIVLPIPTLRALHGSDWLFPSRRRINGKLGHLDVLDRPPLTAPGDVRHLWNEAAMSVVIP